MRPLAVAYAALLGATLLAETSTAQPAAGVEGAPRDQSPRQGRRPQAGPGLAAEGRLERPPMPKTEDEKRILAVLDELGRGPSYLKVSPQDGRLLRLLTEAAGARRVVEIGTYSGYSGIWFCLALRKTGGALVTHEIDPQHAALARANFRRAGVEDLVTIVEGDAHRTVLELKGPIDILFLDADKPGYVDYLNKLLPLIRPGGLILAHNMRQPPPDPRYIEAITTNPDLETSFLLMEGQGVGVTLKKR